jgi:hypothetical protein
VIFGFKINPFTNMRVSGILIKFSDYNGYFSSEIIKADDQIIFKIMWQNHLLLSQVKNNMKTDKKKMVLQDNNNIVIESHDKCYIIEDLCRTETINISCFSSSFFISNLNENEKKIRYVVKVSDKYSHLLIANLQLTNKQENESENDCEDRIFICRKEVEDTNKDNVQVTFNPLLYDPIRSTG